MTEPDRRPRVVVIGAGIAGLTAAREVLRRRPDASVVVLDAADAVGGKLRLGEVAGQQVDLGAESILNRRPEAVDLARDLGLPLTFPAASGAGVWTRGEVRPFPATLMGIPGDLREAAASGVLSRVGALRAAVETRLPAPDLSDDVGVGVLVSKRLGREVRDRLVEPLLGGVYAGHADEISLHAALPQVVGAVQDNGGLLAAARAAAPAADGAPAEPVFAGIEGGVGRLTRGLKQTLIRDGAEVRTQATVRELTRTESGWRLTVGPTADAETVVADVVVVAIPAPAATRLLRESVPAAARELGRIEYASMAVVTLAFEASSVRVKLAGSGFLVPPVDGQVIKAATFSSQKWAWMSADTVVVRCSIGRHREEAELQRDDGELVEAAAMDLREATGLHAPLVDAAVTRWGGALPQYAVGHVDRVRRIHGAVAAVSGVEVCGAAYEGIGIAAVIANAQAAATRVVQALGPAGTMGA